MLIIYDIWGDGVWESTLFVSFPVSISIVVTDKYAFVTDLWGVYSICLLLHLHLNCIHRQVCLSASELYSKKNTQTFTMLQTHWP